MDGKIVKGTIMADMKRKLDEVDEEGVLENSNKIKVEMPMRISLDDVAVVDVETSGIHPSCGGLLTVGIYNGDTVEILQRLVSGNGYHKEFRTECINYIDEEFGDYVLYAYNKSYENRWLDRSDFFEVDPRGSGNRKKDDCVSFEDFHYGKGKDVIDSWRSWKRGSKTDHIKDIIMHNFNCVIKETSLFLVNNVATKR